jgi:hypothetical protein
VGGRRAWHADPFGLRDRYRRRMMFQGGGAAREPGVARDASTALKCAATEAWASVASLRAGEGTRTLDVHLGDPFGMPFAVRKTALRRYQRGFTVAAAFRSCQLFLRTSVQFRTRREGWSFGLRARRSNLL